MRVRGSSLTSRFPRAEEPQCKGELDCGNQIGILLCVLDQGHRGKHKALYERLTLTWWPTPNAAGQHNGGKTSG